MTKVAAEATKPAITTPAISQAMIDAYDEYTHLTLDRRRFMEQLTRLAGSGAAAASLALRSAASEAAKRMVKVRVDRRRSKTR